MIHVASDGKRFMGTQRGKRYDESLKQLPKVPTNDPPNKNAPPEGEEDDSPMKVGEGSEPGGALHENDYKMHGQAHKVTITHDSTGHRVEAEHQDGYTHKSTHLTAGEAWTAGKHLAGITAEMEQPQEGPQRQRAHPTGEKEESRQKKENQGMGIHVSGGIPGLA